MKRSEREGSAASHKSLVMSRIYLYQSVFFPDHSATSQMVSDLAFALAAGGRAVSVVTSQQRYDDPNARLPQRQQTNGVDIHRIPTTRFGRSGLWGRGIDYLETIITTACRSREP